MKKIKFITIILIAVTLLIEIIKNIPILVETFYSRFFYTALSSVLNSLSNWTNVSVGEIGLYLAIAFGTGIISLAFKLIFTIDFDTKSFKKLVLLVVFCSLSVSFIFNISWGLNYYRYPLAKHLGITLKEHSEDDLIELSRHIIEQANTLSAQVSRDDDGVTSLSGGYLYVFENTNLGYAELGKRYPLFKKTYNSAKPITSSWVMSYLGISGIYSPLTAEANVNIDIEDVMLPSTTMHEIAHLYGIAREDEANFVAYLSSINHPDVNFQYSGTILALIHSMNALHKVDTDAYLELRKLYSKNIENDLEAISAFWRQYDGKVEELHTKMNDKYLKANGQTNGVKSYGHMVDLLLELDQLEIGFIE